MDIEKVYAEEAKERQGARTDLNITQKIAEGEKGETAEKVASVVRSNKQYVKDVKKLATEAPDLLEQVRIGEINIPTAKKEN